MLVKPGKHIDVSGLCKIDYTTNWEKKYEVRCALRTIYFSFRRSPSI
jgi:hypothetical protein